MSVAVAAYGWEHSGWSGSFYPEDLPEDWRLDYYANEFSAVAVPAGYWQGEPEVAAWRDATPDGFAFFLEVPSAAGPRERMEAGLAVLDDRVGGLLLRGGAEAGALAGRYPVCPLAGDGTVRVDTGGARPLAVARWGRERGAEPAALRAAIEGLAGRAATALLLFEGNPPDPEAMRTAGTLIELLGVDRGSG